MTYGCFKFEYPLIVFSTNHETLTGTDLRWYRRSGSSNYLRSSHEQILCKFNKPTCDFFREIFYFFLRFRIFSGYTAVIFSYVRRFHVNFCDVLIKLFQSTPRCFYIIRLGICDYIDDWRKRKITPYTLEFAGSKKTKRQIKSFSRLFEFFFLFDVGTYE